MSQHEKSEALPFGGQFLAVQRQGDGADERHVIGVAVEGDDQGAAWLQHGDDLEQVGMRFRAGQRRGDHCRGCAVVVPLMRCCGCSERQEHKEREQGRAARGQDGTDHAWLLGPLLCRPFRAPRLGRRPAVLGSLGLSAILSSGRLAATEAAPRVLRAAPAEVPLLGDGYPATAVWGFDGQVPGPELRVRQGDMLRVELRNELPEPVLDARALRVDLVFDGGMMGGLQEATLDGERLGFRDLLRRGMAWAVNGVVMAGHHHAPLFSLARGRTCVVTLRNATAWWHPIHLHGHTFRVMSRNGAPTNHREWRDTVLMAPREEVEIAFVGDNPGDWMLHCHVLEHHAGGMGGVFRVI